jgi:hypothetical protein
MLHGGLSILGSERRAPALLPDCRARFSIENCSCRYLGVYKTALDKTKHIKVLIT